MCFIHILTAGIDAPGPSAWRQEAAALFETFQTTTRRASREAEEFFISFGRNSLKSPDSGK